MTDNEIIKALECCSMGSYPACRDCPYHDDYVNRGCINKRNADIKDLINRQKAEIERLGRENTALMNDSNIKAANLEWVEKLMSATDKEITEAKAEAIKEFAEKVKNEFHEYRKQYKEVANFDGAAAMLIAKRGVDIILKETVVDQNG